MKGKLPPRQAIKTTLARRSLLHFTNFTFHRYIADPAHALIAKTLDSVVSGETKRLMIFAPPQHGKTELTSVRLPAFWLGRRPNDPIIITSYAASLAHTMSRHARDVIDGPRYREIFPATVIDPSKRAADHWELSSPNRGGVVAAGVGGPITGHGAALGIIDDPFASWERAQSQHERDRVWDWWRGTFRPRVWEDGAIVLIMTRWHEDDLAGRLLSEQADRWAVLRLPALAETQSDRDQRSKKLNLPLGEKDPLGREPGEPLCPSRFSKEALEEIRLDSGSLVWSAQYDGAPTLPEGNKFKRHWFPIVDAAPANARRCRYWDFAATARGGARTAGVKLAIAKGMIYIEDSRTGQWSTDPRNRIMLQTADLDAQVHGQKIPQWFEEEGGSSGKDASRAIIKYMSGHIIKAHRPTGSKDTRLEPFAAQAEAGNVKLIRGPWNGDYIEEMCAIPNGRFRDQADGTSGGYNKLARAGWARGAA